MVKVIWKMMRGGAVVALCLTLWGCGYIKVRSMDARWNHGKSYKVGNVYTANTGSSLLIAGYNTYSFPTYKPKYNYKPPNIDLPSATFGVHPVQLMPPITPDQKWTVRYVHDGNYILFSQDYSLTLGIEIKPDGELADEEAWISAIENSDYEDFIIISKSIKKIFGIMGWIVSILTGNSTYAVREKGTWKPSTPLDYIVFYQMHIKGLVREKGIWKPPNPQLFEEVDGDIIGGYEDSFKAELIYTGKTDNIIRVSYREYKNDMARPAFSQELRYDLNEGNEITFKTLKMKVLEATNTKITVQVIDDGGGLPGMPR
jgi:hypothetical protein